MEPVTIAAIITATTAAATAAATTSTTMAVSQFNSENDAFTATVLNLSKFTFKVTPDTGEPVKGQWMQPLGNLTSLYDLIQEHPNTTEDKISEIVKSLGSGPHGLRPWSAGTIAKAGGGWGPAGIHCYDVYDEHGKSTGDMAVLMLLLRPNWEYAAGVAIGNTDYINRTYSPKENKGWELYKAIEEGHKMDDGSFQTLFSDGSNRTLTSGVLRINFQPAKSFIFKIEDTETLYALKLLRTKDMLGTYEYHPISNGWHTVTISEAGDNRLKWSNKAGRSWFLNFDIKEGKLSQGENSPYPNKDVTFELDSKNEQIKALIFQGDRYTRIT